MNKHQGEKRSSEPESRAANAKKSLQRPFFTLLLTLSLSVYVSLCLFTMTKVKILHRNIARGEIISSDYRCVFWNQERLKNVVSSITLYRLSSSPRFSCNPEAPLLPYPQECLAVFIPPATHTQANKIEMPLSSHTSQTLGCIRHYVDWSISQEDSN